MNFSSQPSKRVLPRLCIPRSGVHLYPIYLPTGPRLSEPRLDLGCLAHGAAFAPCTFAHAVATCLLHWHRHWMGIGVGTPLRLRRLHSHLCYLHIHSRLPPLFSPCPTNYSFPIHCSCCSLRSRFPKVAFPPTTTPTATSPPTIATLWCRSIIIQPISQPTRYHPSSPIAIYTDRSFLSLILDLV